MRASVPAFVWGGTRAARRTRDTAVRIRREIGDRDAHPEFGIRVENLQFRLTLIEPSNLRVTLTPHSCLTRQDVDS